MTAPVICWLSLPPQGRKAGYFTVRRRTHCMQVTPELLSRFALLKPLPRETLEQLAPHAELVRPARRAIVLRAGASEKICFLFEGRLQGVGYTIDGREVGLYFVEPGDFCGELALFDDSPQSEHVIATTAASVVFIARDALREVMLNHSAVSNTVGRKLAERVREMTVQRTLLGLGNIPQRVCGQLFLLVDEAQRQAESSEIVNPPTHLEIAIMLNLSRETVTRVFQTLQSSGIVRRDGPGRLIVTDLGSLRRFAEGEEEL